MPMTSDIGDVDVSGHARFDAGDNSITLGGAGEDTRFGTVELIGADVTLQVDDATVC